MLRLFLQGELCFLIGHRSSQSTSFCQDITTIEFCKIKKGICKSDDIKVYHSESFKNAQTFPELCLKTNHFLLNTIRLRTNANILIEVITHQKSSNQCKILQVTLQSFSKVHSRFKFLCSFI